MADIKTEVLEHLPKDAEISSCNFEGANIILYTKSKDFFLDSGTTIRDVVNAIKKRVELRPDPSIVLDMEKAKEMIMKVMPEDAKVSNVIFDPQRSQVIIEAEKPGLAIGKSGDILKDIRRQTLWVPLIKRTPTIRSKIIENIRGVLYENNDFRRKFLDQVGKRVYSGWIRGKKDEWVRISFLGASRQVGRSCFLLQTPESRILLDCGINVAAQGEQMFPHFDAPELKINEIDAVIVSHAHLDHCLPPHTPVLLDDGVIKPIDEVKEGDSLVGIDFKTGKKKIGRCVSKLRTESHKDTYKIRTPYFTIEASPNHKFFVVDNLEVKEIKADELSKGMIIPGSFGALPKIKSIEMHPVDYEEMLSLPKDAAAFLRDVRKKKGWTQYWVSKQLGKGINYASDIENKYSHIGISGLKDVLKLYGISQETFMRNYNVQATAFPKELSMELAQLVGYLTGDGHISSEYSIRATDHSTECLKHYTGIVKGIFSHDAIIRHHPDISKDAHIIEINNVGIKRFLEENFGNFLVESKQRKVPERIVLGSEQAVRGFIRGIADAEGCVTNNVCISSYSIEMLETLQFLLSSLGIPTSLDARYNRINISSAIGLRKYAELIGFGHPQKMQKLMSLLDKMSGAKERLHEFLPISSNELRHIFEKVGMSGTAKGKNNLARLPLGIVDWKRQSNSYPERKTVSQLLGILNKRVTDLSNASQKGLRQKRIALSLTIDEVDNLADATVTQVRYREREKLKDDLYSSINKRLGEKLDSTINEAKSIISRIQALMDMPVCWQKITTITKSENKYPYLVDIEVEPTNNFIANGVVVHNSAMIPLLFRYGYEGPVYCTEPTRDIMALLALDYISVGHSEAAKQLFTATDVKEMVKHCICLNYEEVSDITPDVRLTLYDAGHILGSAICHLHIGNGLHNLVYTGDLNYETSNLLSMAHTQFPRVETLMIESTYGGKDDNPPSRKDCEKYFLDIVKSTIDNGGKVLLPVLGVGRSQEIQVILERAMAEGLIPKVTVYVQGLVWDITAIHTAYPDYFNSRIKKSIFHQNSNPFLSPIFKQVTSHKEMQAVIESGDPCIIMATSGMMEGGASVEYFKALAENPKHNLVITNYVGPGSLARRLQDGEREISYMVGENRTETVKVRMGINTISGFSGHSSRSQLMSYVSRIDPKPKKILLIHGENTKCLDLASSLHKSYKIETVAPRNLDSIRLR